MLLNEEIAYEGFVLLKNTDNALPLTGQNVKISVFGKNSVNLVYGGSGSGGGNAANNMSLYTALRNAGFDVNPTLESFYNSSEVLARGATPTPLSARARRVLLSTKPRRPNTPPQSKTATMRTMTWH